MSKIFFYQNNMCSLAKSRCSCCMHSFWEGMLNKNCFMTKFHALNIVFICLICPKLPECCAMFGKGLHNFYYSSDEIISPWTQERTVTRLRGPRLSMETFSWWKPGSSPIYGEGFSKCHCHFLLQLRRVYIHREVWGIKYSQLQNSMKGTGRIFQSNSVLSFLPHWVACKCCCEVG